MKISRLRRLVKKSGETIILYHATSSQALLQMYEDGEIFPSGYVDVFSNGDGLGGESPESYGVYLYGDQIHNYLKNQYLNNAVANNYPNKELPNFAVELQIEVDVDALDPDDKDYKYFVDRGEYDDNIEKWKQSLNRIGQVVHYGPISIDNVKYVTILSNGFEYGEILDKYFNEPNPKFKDEDEQYEAFQEFFFSKINFNETYTLNEAISRLKELNDEIYKLKNELE